MKINSKNDFWLVQQSTSNPKKIFIQNSTEDFSYSEVFELSKKSAQLFFQKGIRKGNYVSIISENNLEFIIVINALWFIGAIPILINYRLQKSEIQSLLNHSDSNFLINIKKEYFSKCKEFNFVINFSLEEIHNEKLFENFEIFNFEKTAVMIYSSGSTGNPKLVQLTFNNLFSSFIASDKFINHSEKDIWLATLPFFHIGGFSIMTRTFLSGSKLAIPKSLNEIDLSEAFEKFNPTLISLVPTMLKRILDDKISIWKNLRIAFIGGGPASEKLISDAIKNNFPICLVYGSTETSSMVTFADFDNLKKNGISAGITFPNVELKIFNDNGNELNIGEVGEIVIHSNSVAKKYYKNENLNNLLDGTFSTNDLGKIDENGNLQILGRKDDIIISGGENISLNEIKNLVSQKFNFDLEAIGIKDEKWGQSYILVIETDISKKIRNGIWQYLKDNLASYKLPKQIIFENKFPKTELGKIKKKELAERLKLDVL